MSETKKPKNTKTRDTIFLAFCVLAGIGIGIYLVSQPKKTEWQKNVEEEIVFRQKEGSLDDYILDLYTTALRPNGQTKLSDGTGETYSFQDLYDYASSKTGYKCVQLAPYDENTPLNQMAKCEKQ